MGSPWGVENRLHWVLDRAFREDESRIRTGHAARNLLRREPTAKGGIAARRKQAGWNNEYLARVLSNWNAIALPPPLDLALLWEFLCYTG